MHRIRWATVTALAAFTLGSACSGDAKPEASPTAAPSTPASAATAAATVAAPAATRVAGPATIPPVTAAGADGTVKATISGFKLPTLTVKTGTVVEFVNQDSAAHTATSDDDVTFNSGSLSQNASFKFTANKAGTLAYACAIHPDMKGFVIVQ